MVGDDHYVEERMKWERTIAKSARAMLPSASLPYALTGDSWSGNVNRPMIQCQERTLANTCIS
jgi:hypothetical protein